LRQTIALESGKPDALWSPGDELAAELKDLPETLAALQVTDPRDSLPQAIAGLPATVPLLLGDPGVALPAVAANGRPPPPRRPPGRGGHRGRAGPSRARRRQRRGRPAGVPGHLGLG